MKNKLEILKFPDPRLRKEAKTVQKVTPELIQLTKDMLEVMYEQRGVGLSSTQVNRVERVFVADTRVEGRYESPLVNELEKKYQQPLVFFNPEILSLEGEVIFSEGCLSFPSYYADVKRAQIVEVKALDQTGQPFTLKTDGLLSICIQHEIDHLNGKLFIDHLSPVKAQQLRDKIKKHGYPVEQKI